MTDWPASHHEALKNHLAAGLSASQAAAALNGEFRTRRSRNSIIGRAKRKGLTFNSENIGGPSPNPDKPNQRKPKMPPSEPVITKAASGPKIAATPFVPRVAKVRPRHVSLLELTDHTCRWPISEVGAPDFCFCGNPPVEGFPYCAGHARLAYQPSRPSTRPSYQLRGRA